MIKCLLVSPLGNYGGEDTLTEIALCYPPEGVEYIFYKDAIKNQSIEESNIQNRIFYRLMKHGILPPDMETKYLFIKEDYDIIFVHAFSVKITVKSGIKKPSIVLRDPSSNYIFLRDYLLWSDTKISRYYFRRKIYHKLFQVYDQSLDLRDSRKLIVFSEYAKNIHVKLGNKENKIVVIPPGFPKPSFKKIIHEGINIGFISGKKAAFIRKGGVSVLKVFRQISRIYPCAQLFIVGELPSDVKIENGEKILATGFLEQCKLFNEIYPKLDFVVLPTAAEGFGLSLVEAMSFGLPAISTGICAIPEIVRDGESGLLINLNDDKKLYESIEILIRNEKMRNEMSESALKWFSEKYLIEKINEQIKSIFLEVLRKD